MFQIYSDSEQLPGCLDQSPIIVYQIRFRKPNLPNQTYQIKPTKPNLAKFIFELFIEVKNLQRHISSTIGFVVPLAMFYCESNAMKGFASLCGLKGNRKLANLTNYLS